MALLSKWFAESDGSSQADKNDLAPLLERKAKRSYEYAVALLEQIESDTVKAGCSYSSATENCVGDCSLQSKTNKAASVRTG